MNFIYSFIIFEAGALCGFFIAALMNAARAGQEITIKFEEEDNGAELRRTALKFGSVIHSRPFISCAAFSYRLFW